ncbi:glycosyltransferase family 4 protein [Brevundimonas sp. 374]|uniref:glycosyltransferase family 4 protein n=1 Tax=Brevundimonas sp. 374 TaxID=1150400 RepID=UPI000B88CC48|nr:glycosyltransferase family 4 protein [Brevundimonas sp. 374]
MAWAKRLMSKTSGGPALSERQKLLLASMLRTSDFMSSRGLSTTCSPESLVESYLRKPVAVRTALFDFETYTRRAAAAGTSPQAEQRGALVHWATVGIRAGVNPTTEFDADAYLHENPDVAATGVDAFEHYVLHGFFEGRNAPGMSATKPGSLPRAKLSFRFKRDRTIPNAFLAAMPSASMASDFYNRVVAPLRLTLPTFGEPEAAILVALYEPMFAPSSKLPASASREQHLEHFLMHGLWHNQAPSPLFDPDSYGEMASEAGISMDGKIPALLHWLAIGRERIETPTWRFDEVFYAAEYPDLASYSGTMFEHYVRNGLWEGRRPNRFFDPAWYVERANGEPGLPAYYHYLMHGIDQGFWPSRIVTAQASRRPTRLTLDDYDRALKASRGLALAVGPDAARMAISIFSPLPDEIGNSWDSFIAFLNQSAQGEDYEGVFFSPSVYRAESKDGGFELSNDDSAFAHFLEVGRLRRINTNKAFDEGAYLERYPDLTSWNAWLFEHFLSHGIFEGRASNELPMLALAPALADKDVPLEGVNWQNYFRRALTLSDRIYSRAQLAARSFLNPVIHKQVARALTMEPLVGPLKTFHQLLAPPTHDVVADRLLELTKRISTQSYDSVVCIPWLRTGGADLVACLLAASLRRIYPNESILMLQTDHPAVDRIEWKPSDVNLVDVSDIMRSVDAPTAERLLNTILAGLAPKRVVNVNSNLCWRVFRRFGKRLKDRTDLFGYLFCWDRTPEGAWAGYPSDFYAETANNLAGILTDTQYLKDQLTQIYTPPADLEDRIYPIYTPLAKNVAPPDPVSTFGSGQPPNVRPLVLWAGRLDRQKRFDLAIEIAKAMPDVDFRAWGKALLDEGPDLSTLPKNMTLKESFTGYDELGLEAADAWLFTSEWEGLPTLLIELGARGVPIVASAVGGVPELITPETGWPVHDVESVQTYVAALRSAIASPNRRSAEGAALRDMVAQRHSQAAYDHRLRSILEGSKQ